MSSLPAQTSRKEFVAKMKALGFDGPYDGKGSHPLFMQRGQQVVKLPNPHSKKKDIGRELLSRILRNAGISKHEWLNA